MDLTPYYNSTLTREHDLQWLIGSYLIHYADGQKWEIPIVCGQDIWNFWIVPGRPAEAKRAVVAWTGHNKQSPIALYRTAWENPRPGVEVESIDFLSNDLWCPPFLVALTVE